MTVNLATLYTFLDVDERDGPSELLYVSGHVHYTIPYLVLSAIERDGGPLGPASADELARARRRAVIYDRIFSNLTIIADAEAPTGPPLARLYPAGLLRIPGCLKVTIADEPRLWRAVRWLLDSHPVSQLGISAFGTVPGHLSISLAWDAPEALSDPPFRVELCTAALPGDFGAVPVRAAMPSDLHVAALLRLAEDRFRRDFHARDFIDVAVLGATAFPRDPEFPATVDEYRLAPEVGELLEAAAERHPLGSLATLRDSLPPLAERERARRSRPHTWAGRPLRGTELRRVADRADWTSSRRQAGDHGTVLLTPIGDYLLTDAEPTAAATA